MISCVVWALKSCFMSLYTATNPIYLKKVGWFVQHTLLFPPSIYLSSYCINHLVGHKTPSPQDYSIHSLYTPNNLPHSKRQYMPLKKYRREPYARDKKRPSPPSRRGFFQGFRWCIKKEGAVIVNIGRILCFPRNAYALDLKSRTG